MLVHQACGQTRELTKKRTQVEIKTDRFVINSKRDSHVEFIGLFFHDWKNRQKKNQPTNIHQHCCHVEWRRLRGDEYDGRYVTYHFEAVFIAILYAITHSWTPPPWRAGDDMLQLG